MDSYLDENFVGVRRRHTANISKRAEAAAMPSGSQVASPIQTLLTGDRDDENDEEDKINENPLILSGDNEILLSADMDDENDEEDKINENPLVSPSNEGNEGTDGNQAQATPNKTGCAGDEKIEAKKQRTIEILKAASAKQAKKLEGILEQEDLIIESIRDKRRKEMAGTLIVMATLVATVTFTAAFTLPGGVQSEGPHQGMAVLTRKAAFKAFIVTDTVAMTTSMIAAVILFTSSWNDEKNKWNLHFIALQLLWLSLASMGLAFLTGLFTVLSHSMGLAIVVCFIGCVFPSLLYLLGLLILPEEFVWSLVDIIEKIKTKIYSFWILHN